MENQNIKRGRGRPKIFTDEEVKKHRNDYMLNKDWYCDVCNTGINYKMAGKTNHRRTKMHKKKVESKN